VTEQITLLKHWIIAVTFAMAYVIGLFKLGFILSVTETTESYVWH